VVIVNFARPGDTLACIASLLADGAPLAAITLVDNGSPDDSLAQLRAAYPELPLLALPKNRGFAGGFNAGIRAALDDGCDPILLLNNDTEVEPGMLTALLAAPGDIITPKIVYWDRPERILAAGCRWRACPPGVTMRGYGRRDSPKWNRAGPLRYATGCALLTRAAVFEAIGGFDRRFANYLEDYDFCERAGRAGFRLYYAPAARLRHRVSQTLGAASPRRWEYLGQNSVLFYRRFGRLTLGAVLVWATLRELLKGQIRVLGPFWRGVRHGLARLPEMEADDGSCAL
jgi:GT2 family glycosyltransferase